MLGQWAACWPAPFEGVHLVALGRGYLRRRHGLRRIRFQIGELKL
jgi:hypothetical protein